MTRLLRAARLAPRRGRLAAGAGASAEPAHGIAMYGEPALPPDFVSLPYANPDAPKGGTIVFGETGGFDSLNPYILKGRAPAAIQTHVFETLMARNWDEPFATLRVARRIDRDRAGSRVGRVHAAAGGAVLRRQPGDGRGRDLVDADAGGEGPAKIPECLGKGGEGRADRRAVGALHLRRGRQRAAADHRAAADPEEGGLGRDRFRREQPAGAGRLGALYASAPSSPGASSPSSATRTTGGGTCRSTAG